jgi:hypothetical protein
VNQTRPERVELPPEIAHVRLHDVRVASEVLVPDAVENLLLAQHAARVEQEEPQEVELGWREVDSRFSAAHLPRRLVQDEIGEAELAVLFRLALALPQRRSVRLAHETTMATLSQSSLRTG